MSRDADGKTTTGRQFRWLWMFAVPVLVVYSMTYLWVSRRAYAAADQYGMDQFYYFWPDERIVHLELKHSICIIFFWPANQVDQLLGTGRRPYHSMPMFRLG